jgi:hypothetical protein
MTVDYGLDSQGIKIQFLARARNFLFFAALRLVPGLIYPPFRRV